MKTFDKKDIFTCVTADEAIAYIGNNGYFANSLSGFNHIDCFAPYSLDEVQIGTDKPFVYKKESYALFLPANKIKDVEEKKWRVFKNLDDLKNYTNKSVGSVLVYRQKNKDNTMKTSMITNYVFDTNCISLGNLPFSFETLFDEYEWLNEKGIWQPFGVEE